MCTKASRVDACRPGGRDGVGSSVDRSTLSGVVGSLKQVASRCAINSQDDTIAFDCGGNKCRANGSTKLGMNGNPRNLRLKRDEGGGRRDRTFFLRWISVEKFGRSNLNGRLSDWLLHIEMSRLGYCCGGKIDVLEVGGRKHCLRETR